MPVKLGAYTLIKALGEGSFAVVWLARDEKSGQEAVLKRFKAHVEAEEIRAELENCQRIKWTLPVEKHLVEYRGHVPDPECKAAGVALVFEHCNAGSLDKFLETRILAGKMLTAPEALSCARQLTNGVLLMHSAQLFHRDLAPMFSGALHVSCF